MIDFLKDTKNFRVQCLNSWLAGWRAWYKAGYIHSGIKEFLRDEIFNIFKLKNKKLTISDIGCGTAWLYHEIKTIADLYYGIDFNEKLLKKLAKDFEKEANCRFINFDFEENYQGENLNSDLVIVSLSVVEITNLDIFFENIKKISKDGAYILIVGLNPIFELFRNSKDQKELNKNIASARNSKYPAIISKKLPFNSLSDGNFRYHRILYSIKDLLDASKKADLTFVDLNDKLNYNSTINNSPIYFFLKLKG